MLQRSTRLRQLTQRISRKQPLLLPHTHLHLAVQNPSILAPKEVKVHDRTILAQFKAAANLPASNDTTSLVFLQAALGNEKTCKEVSNHSRLGRECRNRARWFGEDSAQSTRHSRCDLFRGRGLLGARKRWERVFVRPGRTGVDHRLGRLGDHSWRCLFVVVAMSSATLREGSDLGNCSRWLQEGRSRSILCLSWPSPLVYHYLQRQSGRPCRESSH
jgi:hypothetical protein